VTDERKEAQSTVDKQLTTLVSAVPSLRQYLSHKFTLSHGQFPHNMTF
jgi:large subunit ribosomal protein L6e